MIAGIDLADVDRFRAGIRTRLGLEFDEHKTSFLGDVLRRRLEATGLPAGRYVSQLDNDPAKVELGALARELTVPETYFFRNIDQFRALTGTVLPARIAARGAERRLRIVSLGCASGDEAYSLAMLILETLPDPSWEVSILAVDINAAMIEKARAGRYTAWSLREIPHEYKERWFRGTENDLVL